MDQESSREDEALLLSIFDEKIQHNRDTSASPEKGRMHSNLKTWDECTLNFYDHKIKPLTPRPLFTGDVKKINKALYCNISGNDREVNSVLGHDLKSGISRHLWSDTLWP